MEQKKATKILIIIFILIALYGFLGDKDTVHKKESKVTKDSYKGFRIISSSENEDLEPIIKKYAAENNIDIKIEYAGTLDIMEKLNSGEKYDAVWVSNSMWLYMLNSSVKTSDAKSTSINPVIFAVTKSKAKELNFIDKEINTKDIISAIQAGKLKFSMSNPTRTNTGATAYLGLLSSISGSPEVLKKEHIENEEVKQELVSLFSGLERSSGSEEFLEEAFINGEYEAIVTYESSIIKINKELEKNGKEPLYALYPLDGVSISDSPFAYIDHGEENKKEDFLKIQSYILSSNGQAELAKTGRRTWYGGVSTTADSTIFNPNWGIDTTKYIVPIKFPNTAVIQKALVLYQEEFRKPVHTIFCLDFSGSMEGDGYSQLIDAMEYILDGEKASKDLLQFTSKDKITLIPFSTNILGVWSTDSGSETEELLYNLDQMHPRGNTNIYDTATKAVDILSKEDLNTYNLSVIVMTDGLSNTGKYDTLKNEYTKVNKDIPIYSIMFGSAEEKELNKIAELTNAKVFDGRTSLLEAFKEVRGYN